LRHALYYTSLSSQAVNPHAKYIQHLRVSTGLAVVAHGASIPSRCFFHISTAALEKEVRHDTLHDEVEDTCLAFAPWAAHPLCIAEDQQHGAVAVEGNVRRYPTVRSVVCASDAVWAGLYDEAVEAAGGSHVWNSGPSPDAFCPRYHHVRFLPCCSDRHEVEEDYVLEDIHDAQIGQMQD
jgi:hypothetical protein